ncbi:unnamed protein product [Peniophora sp. CBMAI 1063]|nr:unnamed protein product [Peniophora sp. CBMAI 1063]
MASQSSSRIVNYVLKTQCRDSFASSFPQDVPPQQRAAIRNETGDKHARNLCKAVGASVIQTALSTALYKYGELRVQKLTRIKNVLGCNLVLAIMAEKVDPNIKPRIPLRSTRHHAKDLLRRAKRGNMVHMGISQTQHKSKADVYRQLVCALCERIGLNGTVQHIIVTFAPLIKAALRACGIRNVPDPV